MTKIVLKCVILLAVLLSEMISAQSVKNQTKLEYPPCPNVQVPPPLCEPYAVPQPTFLEVPDYNPVVCSPCGECPSSESIEHACTDNMQEGPAVLSSQELDIIASNPARTFVYISQDALDVLNELPKDTLPLPLCSLMEHIVCNNRTAPQEPTLMAIDCGIQACQNEPEKRQILERYKQQIESGEAIITVGEDELTSLDSSRRKKRKVLCSLTVKDCLKTNNLVVCNNAAIGGNLAVRGSEAIAGNLAVVGGIVAGSSAVGGNVVYNTNALPLNAVGNFAEALINDVRGTISTTTPEGGVLATRGAGYVVGAPALLTLPAGYTGVSIPVTFSVPFVLSPSITLGFESLPTLLGSFFPSLGAAVFVTDANISISGVSPSGFTINVILTAPGASVPSLGAFLSDLAIAGFAANFIAQAPVI